MLLLTSPTDDILSAVDTSGSVLWVTGNVGKLPFTTPKVSPDGVIAYFGKQNSVYAIDLFDGSPLWGQNGYSSSVSSNNVILADISVSSTGEFLFYNGFGRTISAIRISEATPTQSPVASPTSTPSSFSSPPPSESHVPSISFSPSFSDSPTVDPNSPSMSPTTTNRPSVLPSLSQSSSPSAASSNAPSSLPTIRSPTLSPEKGMSESPTADPTTAFVTPPSSPVNPPPAPAELPDDSNNEKSSGLGQTAIIGIAVGGGVGLILLLGATIYVCKKKNSDDGLDTDWNPDENSGGGETNERFAYGTDDAEGRQPSGGNAVTRFSRGSGDAKSRRQGGGQTRTQFSYGDYDVENRQQGNLEW